MARILDSIVGHKEKIKSLLLAIENQQLPSQLVFYGPEGIGKKQIALGLTQALVCNIDFQGCGICGPCVRVLQKTSENVLFLSPEKNLIKIEQARNVLDFLSLQAWGSTSNQNSTNADLTNNMTASLERPTNRIVFIEEAHTLNQQAANSLLKVFEEPPPHTYFILITHRPRLLLTTIRSRSKMIGFHPLLEQDIRQLYPQVEEWKVRSARGSLQSLLMYQNSEVSDSRNQAVNYLKEWLDMPEIFFTSAWRDEFKNREVASQVMNWWMLFVRDAIVSLEISYQNVISQDQTLLLQKLAQLGVVKLHEIFKQIQNADRSIWGYQDPVLLVENIFLTGFYS